MIDFLELFSLEINKVTINDQFFLALALISPFCGIGLGIVFYFQLNRQLKWFMTFFLPIGWIVGYGYLLSQLPSKEIRLLIVMYVLALFFTTIYLACMVILSSSEGIDWVKQRLTRPQKNGREQNT